MKLYEYLETTDIPCILVKNISSVRGASCYVADKTKLLLPNPRIEVEADDTIGKCRYDSIYTLVQGKKKTLLYGACHDLVFKKCEILYPIEFGVEWTY